ncbi:MAG TPA: hypothetical protein DCM67_03765 [Propionibacteriaceae bacterium]|nr:hypothetical protein [Propionibacteriaceae bacterium]
MKKLKLTVAFEDGDYTVFAKLHYDRAPKLIEAIEKAGPFTNPLRHARICESEWMLSTPYLGVEDENYSYPDPGDISLHRPGPHFCGWYEKIEPLGTTDIFASVQEPDLEQYTKQMGRAWEHPGSLMTVEIVEVAE